MKRIIFVLSFFMFVQFNGHSEVVIPSSNGYDVHIALTLTSINAPANCPFGYSMMINVAYDISFTGSNIPANLSTLQGTIDCDHANSIFFNLPNTGGIGTSQSSNNWVPNSTCTTATPESLGCDMIKLQIEGPGIPPMTNTYNIAELAPATLPIELSAFSAKVTLENRVRVDWETASEINNDYFTVQRSTDGKIWKNLERIKGAGNSSDINQYSYDDQFPLVGQLYYRLKQTDYDGTVKYSSVRYINMDDESIDNLLLFPNPASDLIQITGNKVQMNNSISVFNILGQDVTSTIRIEKVNNNKLDLQIRDLQRGLYFVKSGAIFKKFYKD